MEGPESSQGKQGSVSGPPPAAPLSELSKALKSGTEALPGASAHLNAAPSATNANLTPYPVQDALANASQPLYIPRWHVRAPSSGLTLVTDLPPSTTSTARNTPSNTTSMADTGSEGLHQSATAPILIDEKLLRTARSNNSLAGSLSPSSAISSPALNALGDLTPLPSPLVMGDSPGPWQRAIQRPRGTSTSSRDDIYLSSGRATLSPSPSLKKKGYQRLKTAGVEAAEARIQAHHNNEAARERNRSISEYTPDSLHNVRPRNVTIGNIAAEGDATVQQHLRREQYLASQRGMVPAQVSAGLPTPPASNASARSVTDEEDIIVEDDDDTKYIAVRQGTQMKKKLWRPVRQLGQGTFSKVYLATCERTTAKDPLDEKSLDLRKLVAIKIVEHGPAGGADEERVELSLKREVEMLRSVSHPSLVRLRAFDHNEAQALLVLTYCPGGDLFDVASDHRDVLSRDVVQRVFAEMVSAVRYLHDKLIVHRDIKLENILLNVPVSSVPLLKNPQSHPYPIATLTDLGLSRRIPAPPESPLLTTRCGSEDYAAPEILLGQPYDGRQTDAWALGVLLYALMEGRLPFDPPPGKPARSRAAHRIARCDWGWVNFGDEDGEWDPEKGKEWAGARECVEGLLKKVSRGRKSLEDIQNMNWVQEGIQVEGGLKMRLEDDDANDTTPELSR